MKKQDFTPTRVFGHFSEITPDILAEYGIKGILTDLDDTLVTHNFPIPSEDVMAWLETMSKSNIPVCIVSNNRKKRTETFTENLNIGFFYNSFKPNKHALEKGCCVMNITPDEAVFIGDQLFTDIKAAKNAGVKSFLVKPLGDKATLFIKIKRIFEKEVQL